MTVTAVEGQYQSWVRNGLIDAIRAAAEAEGVIENPGQDRCTGGGCVGCPWTCTRMDRFLFPDTVGVAYNFKEDTPDVINLKFENSIGADSSGFCSLLLGLAGGIAGSVNGVAGGIFSLGALGCQAI